MFSQVDGILNFLSNLQRAVCKFSKIESVILDTFVMGDLNLGKGYLKDKFWGFAQKICRFPYATSRKRVILECLQLSCEVAQLHSAPTPTEAAYKSRANAPFSKAQPAARRAD